MTVTWQLHESLSNQRKKGQCTSCGAFFHVFPTFKNTYRDILLNGSSFVHKDILLNGS